MRLRVFFFGLLLSVLVACGGSGGSGSTAPFKGISISPNSISLKPNEAIQLTAIVDGGNQAVKWSLPDFSPIPEAPRVGEFVEPGKYKAPSVSGDYRVRAELASDPTKFAEATAHVDSGYVVNISLTGSANVGYGGSRTFSATVTGAASSEVRWSALRGTITSAGIYTAPATPGTDTITAQSLADGGKKKTFSMMVVPAIEIEDGTQIRYALPGSRLTFKGKVDGAQATSGITWSATSGTITSAGVWTADSSTLGDVTITATLASNPTKSITSGVSVQSNLNVRFKFSTAGDIVLALRPDKAPRHSANLVSLVNEKFYDGIKLHRREEGFVVQWGCPFTKTLPLTDPSIGTGGPGYTIDFEANDLKHLKYSLGMARSSSLDSAGSQIYVCLADAPALDGSYVVFGDVASGQAAIDGIQKGDTIVTATVEPVALP